MNKRGNFWLWFGIIVILFWGFIFLLNLDKFSQIPPDANFLMWMFGFSLVIGIIITIAALLKNNS